MANQHDVPRQSTTIHDIPVELLELTFLHIPSTAGIIRAAATCKLWRRVIGDAGFLRRFRRRNGPHILGHHRYYCEDGRTDFFPFPAPAGKEIAAIDVDDRVSLHFLRKSDSCPMHLELHDSRRGLLAFYRRGFSIIVCCPWTKQHRELHPTRPRGNSHTGLLGIFLLDADPDEMGPGLNMSKFRVLCVRLIHYCPENSKIVDASVFSARDDRWLQVGITAVDDIIVPWETFSGQFVLVGRAGGSIFWSSKSTNVILHLDESTGEFSDFTLPGEHIGIDCYSRWNLQVIGGDTSSVHLVRISGDDDLELLCYDRGIGACVVERKVRASQVDSLSDEVTQYRRWYFAAVSAEAAAPGCIVQCTPQCDFEYVWRFSVDTRNIELERVQKFNKYGGQAFPYELPWNISVCLEDDAMEKADIDSMFQC
ncbi:unnamed protein product [Urochloa decumbens]|uniref:F-box domain-containing protein n=1 Tax=Urochloa decumbens TaxID=240449 RepID=A0ABC8VKG6_9POAL